MILIHLISFYFPDSAPIITQYHREWKHRFFGNGFLPAEFAQKTRSAPAVVYRGNYYEKILCVMMSLQRLS